LEYLPAPEIDEELARIVRSLEMDHIPPHRVRAIRSRGTKSRRILARCHGLPKAIQTGLAIQAHYVIELVSENYDRLSQAEQTKTLIHELMHIPRIFGGGFRNHDYVRTRRVNQLYEQYMRKTKEGDTDGGIKGPAEA
jgi:predicted metallopeptidase